MGWNYEGLFDAVLDNEATDLFTERWRNEPSMIPVGRMGYRTRTTKAGTRLEAEVFPMFGRGTGVQLRAAKKNQTKEAQERANYARSIRRHVLLAEANFGPEDYFLHLTYQGVEPDYERCSKDIDNFLSRVKRLRKKSGLPELKYIAVIEGGEGKKRIHAHMLISGGIGRDELEKIWNKSAKRQKASGSMAGRIRAEHLETEDGKIEGAVIYMAKELWAKGYRRKNETEEEIDGIARYMAMHPGNGRQWRTSRNLKRPYFRSSDSKVSNRQVKMIAMDFQNVAKEIMEKIYPGYRFIRASVYYSDVVDEVYIRCVMRKNEPGRAKPQWWTL